MTRGSGLGRESLEDEGKPSGRFVGNRELHLNP